MVTLANQIPAMNTHEKFMLEAVNLAKENLDKVNGGPFGAVVVKDGRIIARGVNTVTTHNDPTAHAEVNAIREACKMLGSYQLDECVIYSSCEPCPMCLGAIYWARPKKLYYGASRQDAAGAGFDDAAIYEELVKPPAGRKLPTQKLEIQQALDVFRDWNNTEHKTEY